MDKRISSRVSQLSAYTDTHYKNLQRVSIPALFNLHVERMYKHDPVAHTRGFFKNSLYFVSNNLPIRNNHVNDVFVEDMEYLVANKIIRPFLLFYQGKFVKWSDVLIRSTHRYDYIYLRNIDAKKWVDHDDIQCILLPLTGIIYRPNVDLNTIQNSNFNVFEDPIFVFDSEGRLQAGVPTVNGNYTIITSETNRTDFATDMFRIQTGLVYDTDIVPKDKYISSDNIIYFVEGLLPRNAIKKEVFNKMDYNSFYITKEPENRTYDIKLFFYKHGNKSSNVLQHVPHRTKDLLKFDKDFDFGFDKNKTYAENYSNALTYIMEYNSEFMNSIYKDASNIRYATYSGRHMKTLIDKNNYITMSTRKDGENHNKVIIHQNGFLCKQYHTISYRDKDFSFYIEAKDIKDDDVFEIMYFKKSYNLVKEIILKSDSDDQYYIGEDVDLNDFTMYSTNLYEDHKYFNIEVSKMAQYIIPFRYRYIDSRNVYEIIPKHPFYYDKNCTLVSNRQFRYMYKKIKLEGVTDFDLSDEFKFCMDIDRYLVYINGRKINKNNFKVTIVKNTRPFHRNCLYTNIVLKPGDLVEVFYVPDKLTEVHVEKKIDTNSGMIMIDKSKLSYNLDKDLYLIYINGRKIYSKDIMNVSKNIIKIQNSESIHNVSIIKHINSIDILHKLFTYKNDIMEKFIKSIDELQLSEKLNTLFGNTNIDADSNEERPFDEDSIKMKYIVHKIIKDFWNKPYVTEGDEFIYDYDTEELDLDSDGNIIVPSMNGND